MAIQISEIKDNLRLAWLSFLEALYTFMPWQRLVLVLGLFMIVFGFIIFKFSSKLTYNYSYSKYELSAKLAFDKPESPSVGSVNILSLPESRYIAYLELSNNNLYLSGKGNYRAVFRGADNRQVYETTGTFFVLPGKNTYIVVPSFRSVEKPVTGQVTLLDIIWQKKFVIPDVSLSAPVPVKFAEGSGTRLEGLVVNNSPYKLGRVRTIVFVYNQQNKVIGLADHSAFSLSPIERRAYVLHFPGISPSDIFRIVPTVETNSADVGNIQTLDNKLPVQDLVQ